MYRSHVSVTNEVQMGVELNTLWDLQTISVLSVSMFGHQSPECSASYAWRLSAYAAVGVRRSLPVAIAGATTDISVSICWHMLSV